MEIKEILHKHPSKRSFTSGIHSLLNDLMPERARRLFTLYVTNIANLRVRHSY